MKILQIVTLITVVTLLFVSCESNTNTSLSDQENRQEIMSSIANDSVMSNEMIGIMMNHNTGRNMLGHMVGDQNGLMSMMKDNPGLGQQMLTVMMETSKNDSTAMNEMFQTMSQNSNMLLMMQNTSGNHMRDGNGSMGNMNRK
ncbi:hypothetical protein LCGC14_0837810 [marine sediment metagenome]|uniref:Membrane or secreted protein n=2 Tax=root TaxID=1 RepID=A0A831QNL6_9FLAO|nr:hypothetical protein [Pricia sp.]HEA22029.1 hypothetical protein [Pricia antarctica]